MFPVREESPRLYPKSSAAFLIFHRRLRQPAQEESAIFAQDSTVKLGPNNFFFSEHYLIPQLCPWVSATLIIQVGQNLSTLC